MITIRKEKIMLEENKEKYKDCGMKRFTRKKKKERWTPYFTACGVLEKKNLTENHQMFWTMKVSLGVKLGIYELL